MDVPNIITGENDRLYITGPNQNDVVQSFICEIPQGLYDLPGIESAILTALENQGAKTTPEPLVSLTADDNTQRVRIRLNYTDSAIDFIPPQTPRDILGFGPQLISRPPTVHTAQSVAKFNQVNYFLIHSDLVSRGIRFNNTYNQTIMQVTIGVSPGSQIVSTPFNPPRVDAQNLAGATLNRVKFWLTDQQNRSVSTNGEDWSVRIAIRWE